MPSVSNIVVNLIIVSALPGRNLAWIPISRIPRIRYTIRAGIERGQWFVVIHPEGVEVAANKILATRDDAKLHMSFD
jgi:hypothetical protein